MRELFTNSSRPSGGGAAHSKRIYRAFTLAEVLITLGIIGIVAALTLPSLIANHKKNVILKQLKKSYSAMSQALTNSVAENGDMDNWDMVNGLALGTPEYKEALKEFVQTHILKYVSVSKDCGLANSEKCEKADDDDLWTGGETYYFFTGDGVRYQISLNNNRNSDGVLISKAQILILVDVNGLKKPNKIGNDIFVISVKKNKIGMFTYGNGYDYAYNNCKNGNAYECGYLIQTNSWNYPKNYPR